MPSVKRFAGAAQYRAAVSRTHYGEGASCRDPDQGVESPGQAVQTR